MTKKAAVFFDRDGTLNVDTDFTFKVEDLKIIDGVIPGLRYLKDHFQFFVTTNQSGVARKKFTINDLHAFHHALSSKLESEGLKIEKYFYCPHHPAEGCTCRKPMRGMIDQALQEYEIDLSKSWVVGDTLFDAGLARSAGLPFVIVLTGRNKPPLERIRESKEAFVAANLETAAFFILGPQDKKTLLRDDIFSLRQDLTSRHKTLVTLNGGFDILHHGHLKIIREAKAQGDFLLVALNSDEYLKRKKGEDRPINNFEKRCRMMLSIPEVDAVTIFEEDTPLELLEIAKPNVHVNGGDYGENCIEAPIVRKHGGRIHVVKLVEGISTTKLVSQP